MSAASNQPITTSGPGRAYRAALVLLILLNFGKTLTFIGAGQPFLESDGVNYWKMGIEFAHGDWLLRERAIAFRPPALPVYLAAMQTCFGQYAIVATTVLQILMDFGTAVVTAWICVRVTGSRAGALIALLLSFFCISRSCFMIFVLADNLLCVALVLYFAGFVAWLKRPSWGLAAVIGAVLAIASLLKPVAQSLWISTLAIMAYRLWRSRARAARVSPASPRALAAAPQPFSLQFLREFSGHAVALLIVIAALLTPWYVRNKVLFGHYFLTQFTGRALWSGCHGRPTQMPVQDSKGPKNQALLTILEGTNVNIEDEWGVSRALVARGYSDYEADKLMEAAQRESILEHPGQYLAGRVLRFVWFWVSPKPWLDVPWGWFYLDRALPVGWPTKTNLQPESYVPPGQVRWSNPFLLAANTVFLKVAWHPNSIVFGLGALAAAIGCGLMVRDPAHREVGLLIASVMLAISLGTILFVWPQYRYRLPLEPFMIVAVTPVLLAICRRLAARTLKSKTAA